MPDASALTLVCFAVREEATAFQDLASEHQEIKVLLTGMGKRNAERTVRAFVERERPALVVSAGFAGGLNPALAAQTVVFRSEGNRELESALQTAGAVRARFHCAERIAITREEKQALRESTSADAVDMESEAIGGVCQEQNVRSAVIRVILDSANEDLPLDFNQLVTDEQRIQYGKLLSQLLSSPRKIAGLLHLQRQSRAAAKCLAKVLGKVLVQSEV